MMGKKTKFVDFLKIEVIIKVSTKIINSKIEEIKYIAYFSWHFYYNFDFLNIDKFNLFSHYNFPLFELFTVKKIMLSIILRTTITKTWRMMLLIFNRWILVNNSHPIWQLRNTSYHSSVIENLWLSQIVNNNISFIHIVLFLFYRIYILKL